MTTEILDRKNGFPEGSLWFDLQAVLEKHGWHAETIQQDSGRLPYSTIGGPFMNYEFSGRSTFRIDCSLIRPPKPVKAQPYYIQRRRFSGNDYIHYKWRIPTWDEFDGEW